MSPEREELGTTLSLDHFSYETLQSASWSQLEAFAVEVLKRYYKPFGLSIRRTQKRSGAEVGSDGARDGEATVVLANRSKRSSHSSETRSSVGSNLGILITLWVEVKKRSRKNVNHHDVGGTIFRSSLEDVTKIVFVCNRSFSRRFRKELAQYALRMGVQFALIDGRSLVEIAETVRSRHADEGVSLSDVSLEPSISVRLHFTFDALLRHSVLSTTRLERVVNEPIFVVADCNVVGFAQPCSRLIVDLRYLGTASFTIMPRSGNEQPALGAGDHFRAVFALFPKQPCELSLDRFDIKVVDQDRNPVNCRITRGAKACSIRGTILPDWISPSRIQIYDEIQQALASWLKSNKSRATDVIAIAGAGKSHLIRQIRSGWVGQAAYEVFLDGGSEPTASAAALALLAQVFPIQMDEVTSELSGSLTEWLIRSGLPEGPATNLAQHLCTLSDERELPFNSSQLGFFLALILAKHSQHQAVILVFEDLHKCLPSSIAMLRALRQSLARLGGGNVFTLFTTREDSVWNDEALRQDWRDSFERMHVGSEVLRLRLTGLTTNEAIDLIKAAIPGVENHYAEAIIGQVGTTPFGIREALGLLIERQSLKPDGRNGVWQLINPEALVQVLGTQELRRATHYRLRGLRERYPEWLADLLDAGACFGQSFDPEVCLGNGSELRRAALEKALAECCHLEIIRASTFFSLKVQFDHDLIRHVLLQDMGPIRQRRIANNLLEVLGDHEDSGLLSSLAYQAGLGDRCWVYAIRQASIASRVKRHMEAVQALGLALTVTDQNLVTKILDVSGGRYRPTFDEAIAVAEPCSRSGLDRESRDRETVKLLLRYIEHLVEVGSAGTPSVEKTLTEGAMLAERLEDKLSRATFKMYQGRQEFNRDRPAEALRLHEIAEGMFSTLERTEEVDRLRASNLVRLAIAYRSNGRLEDSRRTLLRAIRERRGLDWSLVTQVRANFGATFFYTDWDKTRRHWERAVRIARQYDLPDRYVHGLIDVAFLDLLKDQPEKAGQDLERALVLSRDYGFDNSELRCLLNLGCLALIHGEPAQALNLLREADRLGFRHRIGRRLWRVRANMATAYFLLGEVEQSKATDRIALNSMPSLEGETSLLDATRFLAGTRFALALANVVLRAQDSEPHRELLQSLPPLALKTAWTLARAVLENKLDDLPALRGRHCKQLKNQRFFLITE